MSRQQRLALILATAAVAVIAFIALRPSDDSGDEAATTTQSAETTPAQAGGSTATAPTPTAKPKVRVERIRVAAGKPAGGVKEITAEKDERLVIDVSTADTTENVHLHGYDIERDLAPGKPARLALKATIEGVFEIELEKAAVPVAELKVRP